MVTELFASTIGSSAASTTLSGNSGGAITSGATTLKVASNNGFSVTGGQMRAVIEPGSSNAEIVIITGISTLTFTVTRGAEGTTAVIHNDGAAIVAEVTAAALGNTVQLSPTAQQTGNVNVSGSITGGSLAVPHASSHAVGGSDPVMRFDQLGPGPASGGWLGWVFDIVVSQTPTAPTAGTIHLSKILTPYAFTVNNIDLLLNTAGTGATSLANCFVGLYDSSGVRQFVSSDQSTVWNSGANVLKSVNISGGFLCTAADYIYIAILIGTQSSTTCKFIAANSAGNAANAGESTASAYRSCINGTLKTTLTAPLVLSSNALSNACFWAGVR